jgi:hypothetical protein
MSGFDIVQKGDREFNLVDRLNSNAVITFGTGATDTDITYIALRNATGQKCYVYPNGAGNAITVSTTKP